MPILRRRKVYPSHAALYVTRIAMAPVTLKKPIAWPGNFERVSASPATSTIATVDAAGEYVAFIFCAREAMTISHVGFRPGLASGSPTIDVRIEDVDPATGLPTGTLWATNTNIVTGAVASNNWFLAAQLTASASIAKGQIVCVKLAYNSGTSLQLHRLGNHDSSITNLPYEVLNTGTPTKGVLAGSIGLALGSSSTSFYQVPGIIPYSIVTNSAFNNTNGARRGLKFTIPFSCRCVGLRFWNSTSVGDFNAVIFDDAGTPAEFGSSSTAFEGDRGAASGSAFLECYFDNAVNLVAGTTYRAVLEPTSTTNITLSVVTLPSVDYRGATPSGTDAHYTTYASSAWSDVETDEFPLMDLLIDQIDDGT